MTLHNPKALTPYECKQDKPRYRSGGVPRGHRCQLWIFWAPREGLGRFYGLLWWTLSLRVQV